MFNLYQEIDQNFEKKYNCCQVVLAYVSERLGLCEDTALRLGAAFGGGMGQGDTCGCVTAGLMAIGMHYGNGLNEEEKKELMEALEEFKSRFKNKNGSLNCRDLLGLDFGKPEEKAKILESGILKVKCPQLACDAGYILDRLLLEETLVIHAGCGCGHH